MFTIDSYQTVHCVDSDDRPGIMLTVTVPGAALGGQGPMSASMTYTGKCQIGAEYATIKASALIPGLSGWLLSADDVLWWVSEAGSRRVGSS